MSKMSYSHLSPRAKEAGMVSILVTMVLMIVITLIVLGLAQISRRNQRQILDRQLSTQAFYAAETGVNDVKNIFKNTAPGTTIPAKPNCTAGSGPAATYYLPLTTGATLDPASNVAYTCVTVDPAPPSLVFGTISTTSTIFPISSTGSNITTINLTWQTKDATSTPSAGCPTTANVTIFPTVSSWTCGYGIIRFDLVPTDGGLSLAGLQSSQRTSFLFPRDNSGGVFTLSAAAWSNRVGIQCNNTDCHVAITGLNANTYYMRVSSLYKDSSLKITATDSLGNTLALKDAQALVDSTGKAQDVLRRIQVRVPLTSRRNQESDYAIQTTDPICKRFSVMDGYFDPDVAGVTSTNPFCQP